MPEPPQGRSLIPVLTRGFAWASYLSGWNLARTRVGRLLKGPCLRILAYHRVHDDPGDTSPYTVTSTLFDEHMAYIKRRFDVISLTDALRLRTAGSASRDALIITFDDGYEDNFTVARPILRRHGLEACFFVTSGFVGHRGGAPESAGGAYPRMSKDQLRALLDEGFEVGAHTRTHPNLIRLDRDRARTEIAGSKHDLERCLQAPVTYFAYPYGKRGVHFDDTTRAIVEEEFSACCTTTRGRNGIRSLNPLELHRMCVQSWWSRFHLARELEGTFDFLAIRPLSWT